MAIETAVFFYRCYRTRGSARGKKKLANDKSFDSRFDGRFIASVAFIQSSKFLEKVIISFCSLEWKVDTLDKPTFLAKIIRL